MAIIKSKFLINKIKNWYKNPYQKNFKNFNQLFRNLQKKYKNLAFRNLLLYVRFLTTYLID